jgi:hypothetical protein
MACSSWGNGSSPTTTELREALWRTRQQHWWTQLGLDRAHCRTPSTNARVTRRTLSDAHTSATCIAMGAVA